MNRTPTADRSRTIAATSYCAAFVAIGIGSGILGPTLPHLAERTGASLGKVSSLFSAVALGYLTGSYVAGAIFDRWAGHPIVAANLAAIGLLLLLATQSTSIAVLFLIFLLLGFVKSLVDVGGNTLLFWIYPPGAAGGAMNALHAAFAVGAVITPVVVGAILDAGIPFTIAYTVLGIAIIPLAIPFLVVRSPAIPEHPASDPAEASSARTELALICLLFFLYSGLEICFGGWLTTYAYGSGFLSDSAAAYLVSVFWAFFAIGRLLVIGITDRWSPVRLVVVSLSVCAAGLLVMLFSSKTPSALWIGSALFGFGVAPLFAQYLMIAESRLHLRGAVTRWFFISASAGAIVFPWILGQLFDRFGLWLFLPAIFLFLAAESAGFAWIVVRDRRHRAATSR